MTPQLSSTSVEVVQPATRLSWSILPQPRWENSQLSVGAPHTSLDLLGRYKCWSLKDESPAHIVWKNVSKAIMSLLEDQYEHLDAGDSELMVEMFMIGRKPTSSIPTILFSCESKTCRQKAPALVRRKGILRDHTGVLMAGCSKLPRPLALDEETDAPQLPPGIYVNGPLRSFGTSVLIYSEEGKLPRKATIGGIVTIDHELFGVTAAHAFLPTRMEEDCETEAIEFAFFGEDPFDSGDDEDLVELTSQASMSSRSSQSSEIDESEYNFQESVSSSLASTLKKRTTPSEDRAVINELGELFASTEAGDRLDWALVKIRSSPFTHQFTHLHHPSNIIWGEKPIYRRSVRNATSDVRVLIFTGSEGVVEGSLSGVISFTINSNAQKFQLLLTVQRLAGNFSDGDCGSWVFDKETRDVYRHVVSGYPSNGTAYIVPLVQIFQNIQHRIGKPVELFAHTSNKSLSHVFENLDSTIRRTMVHDLDAPRPRVRISDTYEHVEGLSSEPPDPNQSSEGRVPHILDMAVSGFLVSELIDTSIHVKFIYDDFYNKNSNFASQLIELIHEIDRFAHTLQENKETLERAGLDREDYDAIYNTLNKCIDFICKYKAILATTRTPTEIWGTVRFPYSKDYVQDLKNQIHNHNADVMNRCILHIMDTTSSPNNSLTESLTDDMEITTKRLATITHPYPVSPSLDGLYNLDLPIADLTITNSKYAHTTKTMRPATRSLEKPGFPYDRQSQAMSPHRPSSSYGLSPQNISVPMSADTFRDSLSSRSSPMTPLSSLLSSAPSLQDPFSALVLPQPQLDYVVANMWFGSRNIELRRRPGGRSYMSSTSTGLELVIIDENNEERLTHRIKLLSNQHCYPYTWNSGNHYALSVTFKGIPESSHSVFFKGKPIDLESHIPSYDFTNFADFADFQSAVRNKIIVSAFAVAKIASETSGKYGDATDQHLKIWLDKETQEYSISYYASSLKKPCDLEFPFKVIRKEAERTKHAEELILRFDLTHWAQLRAASPSLVRTPSSNVLDSDYAPSRHNTFSTLSTMSTDRTASTTGDFPVVRQHWGSGHSVASESLTSSSLHELTTEMKFLRITFSDDNEASSFHNAYRNAVASTPS